MKREHKYFATIVALFVFFTGSLLILLKKYFLLTFSHFAQDCRQIASTFWLSGSHYIGLGLVTTTLLVTFIIFAKTMFSFAKTQRKLNNLLNQSINKTPKKILRILNKHNIPLKKVVVAKLLSDQAMAIGFFRPKIIISTTLVKHLPNKQLESVILHELYHLQNHHPLLLIIAKVISSSLFFIPLLKELLKATKITFENQADLFVISKQHTNTYLTLALKKLISSKKTLFYPNFSWREKYNLNTHNINLSIIFILLLGILFFIPTQSHAYQTQTSQTNLFLSLQNLTDTYRGCTVLP